MARPRKRKTNRNPGRKVSRKQGNKKNISFEGVMPIIKENWDKTKTLKQNYDALGLVANLNGRAGGVGNEGAFQTKELKRIDELKDVIEWRTIESMDEAKVKESAATVESNPLFEPIEGDVHVDQRVLRIGAKMNLRRARELDSLISPPESSKNIVAAMEEQAKHVVKVINHQSEQENLVFEKLIAKYGDDYNAMARDMKLNKYQLSVGQLKKKMKKVIGRELIN
ncbi:Nucleolar protein 16 [Globomyces sp. JEL0801]|nr:Nucleolar protein 16 [Globomyces sp. JEL0801]